MRRPRGGGAARALVAATLLQASQGLAPSAGVGPSRFAPRYRADAAALAQPFVCHDRPSRRRRDARTLRAAATRRDDDDDDACLAVDDWLTGELAARCAPMEPSPDLSVQQVVSAALRGVGRAPPGRVAVRLRED